MKQLFKPARCLFRDAAWAVVYDAVTDHTGRCCQSYATYNTGTSFIRTCTSKMDTVIHVYTKDVLASSQSLRMEDVQL